MLRRWLLFVLFIIFAHPVFAACDAPVKFGELTWESGQFTTAMLRIITEDGYGCPGTGIPGTGPALENALAQNDIQVIGETWVGRSVVMQQAVDDGRVAVIGDTLKGGARQGWYVPDYVWNQYPQLRSYQDLPRFAQLFADPANPTRARLLNCPTGWVCETFNTRLLRSTGLDKSFSNIHPGTGAALDAEISAAYEQKKPLLFYYWQPTGLMAKYHFKALNFPAYNAACWQYLLKADGKDDCISGFPVSPLAVAVSAPFKRQHPELIGVYQRIRLTPDQLNGAILAMTENNRSGEQQARIFLHEHPEVWRGWVSSDAASRLETALAITNKDSGFFPAWSVQDNLNRSLKALVRNYGESLRQFSAWITHYLLLPIEHALAALPPWLLILATGALAWHGTRRVMFAVAAMAGLFLTGAFGLWAALLQTLALLLVAVCATLLTGIPTGILIARRDRAYRLLLPALDVMQTMPSFVYLIPVLMLFGLGNVPALFATVLYAVAPLIRLTALGIRQVRAEMLETGLAFGSNRRQMLRWVVLPLAKPSIMAGINQAVMMSLSMVVLASMIGAPGLGEQVLQAIQTLNVGQGVQSGGAIVILAVIIDRITQSYGQQHA